MVVVNDASGVFFLIFRTTVVHLANIVGLDIFTLVVSHGIARGTLRDDGWRDRVSGIW